MSLETTSAGDEDYKFENEKKEVSLTDLCSPLLIQSSGSSKLRCGLAQAPDFDKEKECVE